MDPTDDHMEDNDDPMQDGDDNELPFMSDAIQDEADRDQAELEADALLQDDEGGDSDEAGEDLFASDMERYVLLYDLTSGITRQTIPKIDTIVETLMTRAIMMILTRLHDNWWI